LRPIARLTQTAQALSTETLDQRINLGGPDDELRELADTFDDMLGRLDQAFDSQRLFVANASHELRTPLSVILTELEVTLSDPDASLEELRRMGSVVVGAAERAQRLVNSLLTLDTKPGRKVAAGFHRQGAPLIRVSVNDVERAGVVLLPRITGATDVPADVRTIIWATGYKPAFEWIEDLPLDADSWPSTNRGVVPELPGLYFVGMPFQYALTSGLVGGVGRDAEYVVEHLMVHQRVLSWAQEQ